MKLKYLVRTAGLSALAAAMAATALPAESFARDHDRGGWSQGAQNGNQGRADRGSWQGQARAPRAESRATPPTPHAGPAGHTPQATRGGRTDFARPGFAGRTPQAPGVNRTYERTNNVARNYSDQGRNRTYADARRDRSYGADRTIARTDARYTGSRYNGTRGYDGNRRYDGRNGYNGNRRYDGRHDGNHVNWNRGWRDDHRYDWHDYRNSHRSVYHLGTYYSPYRSWSYRPLSIGFYLDPLFYSSSYWIDDPYQYRLPEAYGPYRWVRYYDDALLVDIYSGEVVDVIHDFFW